MQISNIISNDDWMMSLKNSHTLWYDRVHNIYFSMLLDFLGIENRLMCVDCVWLLVKNASICDETGECD